MRNVASAALVLGLVACNVDLGVTDRNFACVMNDDCVSGQECVADPSLANARVCRAIGAIDTDVASDTTPDGSEPSDTSVEPTDTQVVETSDVVDTVEDVEVVIPPCVVASSPFSFWRGRITYEDSAGSAHASARGEVGLVPSKVGQGFSFDGESLLTAPNDTTVSGANELTLAAWVKLRQRGDLQIIIGQPGRTQLALGSDGRLQLSVLQSNFQRFYVNDTAVLPVGQWTHVVGTVEKEGSTRTLSLFVNGRPVASQVVDNGVAVTDSICSLSIGGNQGSEDCGATGDFFDGELDEVAVYHRALDATEVQILGETGVCGTFCEQGMCAPNGTCAEVDPVTCAADADATQCQSNLTCDVFTGGCVGDARATSCDDGNACTATDTCRDGVCGGSDTGCHAADFCWAVTTCDAGTCVTNTPPPTPLAHWRFEGTLASEESATVNAFGNWDFERQGQRGQSIHFVENAFVQLPTYGSTLGFSVWLKLDARPTETAIVAGSPELGLQIDQGGKVHGVKQLVGNEVDAIDPNGLLTGVWTHYVMMVDFVGSEYSMSLYRNGRRVATDSKPSATPSPQSTGQLGDSNLKGSFDELRIYGSVLDATQIEALYSYDAGGKKVDFTSCGGGNMCCDGQCLSACP